MGARVDAIAARWVDRELRAAAGWHGFAVAAAPVLDRLDDSGWLTTMLAGSFDVPAGGLAGLGWSAFFIALGVAAAVVIRRHRPRARWWFLAGCAAPLVVYAGLTGWRASAAVSALGFAIAALRLRAARPHDTLQPDVDASPRYAGAPRDVHPQP